MPVCASGFGQLWQQTSPDTGTTHFVYDADGRLASKTRADGTLVTYQDDALNRVIDIYAAGLTRTYTWDYAYDNMGHLAVVDYPDGNQALYDYTDGAVADVRMKVGSYNITGISSITYRPMDLAMSNWTSYNGLTNAISYDSDLRPSSIVVPNVESLAFAYDADDRVTHITNGMNAALTQTLGYDAVDRLTSVVLSSDDVSYSYDADGNRTSKTDNGAVTGFGYAAGSNHLTSVSDGTTYGYDADGDTTTIDGKLVYQYGPFGRLANAGGDAYRTSAEGQRLFKQGSSGTTYFAPDAGRMQMAEYDPSGVWLDYVWLNGRIATVLSSTGGVYPVHADQTGRPIAMTNLGNQSIIWQSQNLPFKSAVTTTTWFNFNFGFPGQYYDSESGLWYNGNRDYDADLGRYIESDPIGLAGGVNTYAYVGNNPVSNVDPLGLCPSKTCGKPPALPPGASVKANIQQIQMDRAFAGPALIFNFYNLVRNSGPWDYKQQGSQYQAAGNFNYGATGAAGGFSTQLLLRAAGYAQIEAGTSTPAWEGLLGPLGGPPYGDDPADQAEIKAGIAYYNCLASGGQ